LFQKLDVNDFSMEIHFIKVRRDKLKSIAFLKQLFSFMLALYVFYPSSVLLAQPFAYITNYNEHTLSVIDTATNMVSATTPVGHCPDGVAVNPTGALVYVANSADWNVSVIDTATNTVTDTIPVGVAPRGVAVNLSGNRVYVTNYRDNTVSVVDTAVNSAVATVSVGNGPYGVAVNGAETYVYVANSDSNSVSVINAVTNSVTDTISVGSGPYGLVVEPAGESVYVANSWSNNVSVIDTMTNTVIASIPVGESPWGIAIDPAGSQVYVANWQDNTVSIIETETNTVTGTVSVGTSPQGIAVNQMGSRVYVANYQDDTVSALDAGTGMLISTISVGDGPNAFGEFIGPGGTGHLEDVQFVGLTTDLTDIPQAGDSIAFTSNVIGPGALYYKFLYKAGYGTAAWNTNQWVSAQGFSTNNAATFSFPSVDNYCVIAQASDEPNVWSAGDPQAGITVNVNSSSNIQLISLTSNFSNPLKAGDPITFTANATASGALYYKFLYKAGYGTAAWNTNQWVPAQGFSTNNAATFSFPSVDNYCVIAQASDEPNVWSAGDPQAGMTIKVESQ
jgi:YVTN family beta-propeller protein